MKLKVMLFLSLFIVSFLGFAGEKENNVGLLFKTGSSNSVGAEFQLSDKLSLRTTLGLSIHDSTIESTSLLQNNTTEDGKDYNAALGLFYHFLEKKDLSIYSGFEFGYTHSIVDYTNKTSYQIIDGSIIFDPIARQERNKRNGYSGNLILGVRHRLGKRISIFGEIGFGYEKSDANNKTDGTYIYDAEYTDWNLRRSGIGIIFFL